MPKRNVKERRKRALEFKRMVQNHGWRKKPVTTAAEPRQQLFQAEWLDRKEVTE